MKYAIGVDLGATNVRIVVGSSDGKFLFEKKELVEIKGNKDTIANQIVKMIEAFPKLPKIEAIGIGAASPFEVKNNRIISHPVNGVIKDVDFINISKRFKKPIYILNDCSVSVLGEKFYGLGKNIKDFIYVTISTGVGGAAIVNGELFLGKNGEKNMEPGAMRVSGSRSWEDHCAGRHINDFYEAWTKENNIIKDESIKTAKDIFEKTKNNDQTILKFLDKVGDVNAMGVANLVSIFNPDLIIFGGSVSLNNKEWLLSQLNEKVKKYTYVTVPKFKITKLGDKVGLYGALAAAFNKIGYKI